jgi:hypothetical protein
MMINKKKVAALIVRGLEDFNDPHREKSTADKYMEQEQGIKTPEKHKESNDSRVGYEVAMCDFIEAVKGGDVKKACKAMLEFQEMSEGAEYYKESMHGDSKGEG